MSWIADEKWNNEKLAALLSQKKAIEARVKLARTTIRKVEKIHGSPGRVGRGGGLKRLQVRAPRLMRRIGTE